MKRALTLLLALCMVLSISACSQGTSETSGSGAVGAGSSSSGQPGEETGYKTITNVDGTEIQVPITVERIGCLFGPSYEKVVVLGAEDKIVFDGDFHSYSWPWSNVIYQYVNDVPGIPNAHSEPNIEDLMTYEPDVVFNFPNPTTTATMEAAGMSVVPSASTGSYDDVVKMLEVYAQAIGGDAPEIAQTYADYFYAMTDMIAQRVAEVPEEERPTVYFANQEILNCSDKTDLIQRCGGVAVAAELSGTVTVEKEQLLAWNPDYIFVDHAGSSGNATAEEVVAEMLSDADYQSMTAVTDDNVIIVPTGVFFWDSGVQQPLLMLLMAQTMYPELFSDVDMKATLIDFYSQFFYYDLSDTEAEQILAHLDPVTEAVS